MNSILILLITVFSITLFFYGRSKSKIWSIEKSVKLKALPKFYGYYLVLWCSIPSLVFLGVWTIFEPVIIKSIILKLAENKGVNILDDNAANLLYEKVKSIYSGNFFGDIDFVLKESAVSYAKFLNLFTNSKIVLVFTLIIASIIYSLKKIKNNNKARDDVEFILKGLLFTSSLIAILTTIGIIFSLLFESIKFFSVINVFDYLFGTNWSPQRAFVRDATTITSAEYEELKDAFGFIPLIAGTAFIALIAMLVAVPIGLFSGIYMAEYASIKVRKFSKPIIEILAGIPTVVYGFFAALTVGPFFRELGESLGLTVSSESALAAGLIMGIMIIPYISSLSDDVINSVPQSLRDASYAIGATQSETIKKVVIPAALPGIIGSILLAVSRAIGETMIVVMAAGLAANLTINPLDSTTTITTQIVMILVGDQEFNSPKTQSAFALGLTLFIATLILNYIALRVVKKYREKYE
ncbi:MAG: phosphate ABC transporter permease [Pelagibacteraceae bacterium BACL5 MAG-121015-bin10]|jgi:phosphate transport system permease protein|nr:MAG: phosphate ABC transporter permease [Pelagibacteraceae bacterium BACL5 MAG-121015-bin10]